MLSCRCRDLDTRAHTGCSTTNIPTMIVHYQATRRRYASFWMCDIDPLNSCRLCRQAAHWKNLATWAKGKNQRRQGGGAFAPTSRAASLDRRAEPPRTHASVRDSPRGTATRSRVPKPGVRRARGRESRGRWSTRPSQTTLMPESRRAGRDALHSNPRCRRACQARGGRGGPWECSGGQASPGKGLSDPSAAWAGGRGLRLLCWLPPAAGTPRAAATGGGGGGKDTRRERTRVAGGHTVGNGHS